MIVYLVTVYSLVDDSNRSIEIALILHIYPTI